MTVTITPHRPEDFCEQTFTDVQRPIECDGKTLVIYCASGVFDLAMYPLPLVAALALREDENEMSKGESA